MIYWNLCKILPRKLYALPLSLRAKGSTGRPGSGERKRRRLNKIDNGQPKKICSIYSECQERSSDAEHLEWRCGDGREVKEVLCIFEFKYFFKISVNPYREHHPRGWAGCGSRAWLGWWGHGGTPPSPAASRCRRYFEHKKERLAREYIRLRLRLLRYCEVNIKKNKWTANMCL